MGIVIRDCGGASGPVCGFGKRSEWGTVHAGVAGLLLLASLCAFAAGPSIVVLESREELRTLRERVRVSERNGFAGAVEGHCRAKQSLRSSYDLIHVEASIQSSPVFYRPGMNTVNLSVEEFNGFRQKAAGLPWAVAHCVLTKTGGVMRVREGEHLTETVLYGENVLAGDPAGNGCAIAHIGFKELVPFGKLLALYLYVSCRDMPSAADASSFSFRVRGIFGPNAGRVVFQDRDWFYGESLVPIFNPFRPYSGTVPIPGAFRPAVECLATPGIVCRRLR